MPNSPGPESRLAEPSPKANAIRALGGLANVFGLLIAELVLFAIFWKLTGPNFASQGNIATLFVQTTIVALGAIGMTFVIISGGIDLSIGSMVAFVTVVIAAILHPAYQMFQGVKPGFDGDLNMAAHPALLALAVGLLAGAACGLFNGLLITRLKISPFIATLATMGIFRGVAKGFANEQKVDAPLTWLADLLARLPPERQWMLVPPGVWLMLVCSVLGAVVLRSTRFGRQVVAVGGNEQAAHYSGLSVANLRLCVYVIAGLFAGLAGAMQFSRLTVGDPTVAVGLELDVIAAVVIGGASLNGGQGSIAGSILGALIMSTIRAGCSQYGLSNWVQEIVTGAIIVLAVGLDRWRKRGG